MNNDNTELNTGKPSRPDFVFTYLRQDLEPYFSLYRRAYLANDYDRAETFARLMLQVLERQTLSRLEACKALERNCDPLKLEELKRELLEGGE